MPKTDTFVYFVSYAFEGHGTSGFSNCTVTTDSTISTDSDIRDLSKSIVETRKTKTKDIGIISFQLLDQYNAAERKKMEEADG